MICKKCGGQMPDYARFCGICGADMAEDQNASQQQMSTPVAVNDTEEQMSLSQDAAAVQPPPEITEESVAPQSAQKQPEEPIPVIDGAGPSPSIQTPNDTEVPPVPTYVPETPMMHATVPDGFAATPPSIQPKKTRTAKTPKARNKAALVVWIISGVLVLAAVALVLLFAVFPDILNGSHDRSVAAVDRDDSDDDRDDRDDAEEIEETEVAQTSGEEGISALQPETAEVVEDEPVEALPAGEIPEGLSFPLGTTVGVLLPSYQSSEMEQDLIGSFSERGADVVIMRSESDQSTELMMMQTLIAQGVDAIVVFPVAGVPIEGIEMAQSAGIPVVSGMVLTEEDADTVQLDFTAVGAMAISMYAEKSVLVIGASSQADYTNRIMTGIDMGLEERPGSVIFDVQYSDFNSDNAVAIVESALTSYPEIDTVMCFDYVSTQSVYDLLESMGFAGTFIALTGDTMIDEFDVFGGMTHSVLLYFDTNECILRCADMAAYLLQYGDSGSETVYIEPLAIVE